MEDTIYHEDSLNFEDAKISNITPINSTISKGKIYVMYTGDGNAKHMHFSKEVIEAAIPSALDMPVRAFYDESATDIYGADGDYAGHETKYDSTKGKIVRGTHPFGVIPESASYGFEIDSKNREWFWIDCYLWRTCVAYEKIEELKFAHQSTELGNISYTLNSSGNVVVKSFEFQGFCVLGTTRVPAFEDSSVSLVFEDTSDFTAQFEELKLEVKKLVEKVNATTGKETNGVPAYNFEMDYQTIADLAQESIRKAVPKDDDGRTLYVWVCSLSPSMVVWEERGLYYGSTYTIDGANVVVDYVNKKPVYREWRYIEDEIAYPKFYEFKKTDSPSEATFENELLKQDGKDNERMNSLIDENSKLRLRVANEIVSKYEPVLAGNEQFEALKGTIEAVSDVDVFEKDIKCVYADMKLQESATQTPAATQTMVEAAVGSTKPATHNARYGNLINKYSKKREND